MYAQERRRKICEELKSKARVSVEELSEKFDVSKATIRRDINTLHEKGFLTRTHGGAISNEPFVFPEKFKIRESQNAKVKSRLGKFAATMIRPFDTIMIDGGTTTFQSIVELAKREDLQGVTVITNSIPVTLELTKNPYIKAILVGGNLAANELSTVGPLSTSGIDYFKATKVILGASGIDLKHGLTEGDQHICELKKKMLSLGGEKIIVTDSSKFGKVASFSLAPLHEVDIIITDSLIDTEIREAFVKNDVNVIIV